MWAIHVTEQRSTFVIWRANSEAAVESVKSVMRRQGNLKSQTHINVFRIPTDGKWTTDEVCSMLNRADDPSQFGDLMYEWDSHDGDPKFPVTAAILEGK